MTLALYGKSKRRQGSLLLLGVFAVFVALLAGMSVYRSERANAATVNLFSDSFATNGATIPGSWTDSDGAGTNAHVTSNTLQLRVNASAAIGVDTTGYTDIVVNFSCFGDDDNGDSDDLVVEYSSNGGSTWTTGATFDTNNSSGGGCQDDDWRDRSVDLSAVAAIENNASFVVRFRSVGHTSQTGSDTEDVNIDNVVITGFQPDVDTDSDGIPDATDQCPGTAPGATTYYGSGCSVAQYIGMLNPGTANTISGNFCAVGDFNFVIDMSGSIGPQDGSPSNLPAMQAGITGFVNAYNAPAPGSGDGRYSGTRFNGSGTAGLTGGFVVDSTFNTAVNALTNPNGLTPTAAGINAAVANNGGDRPAAPNMMFVVTDGSPNNPPGSPLGDPMTWVNAANAAITAADNARASYLVRAIYVSAPGDPGDTTLPFNDADKALWAQAVMDRIDGSPGGALSADFSNLATDLLNASGCNPSIVKSDGTVNVGAGTITWTIDITNLYGVAKTFTIQESDSTALLTAETCTNSPTIGSAAPWACEVPANGGTAQLAITTALPANFNACDGGQGSNTASLYDGTNKLGEDSGSWSHPGGVGCPPAPGTLIIGKVKDPTAGVPAADNTLFGGTIANGNPATWSGLGFGLFVSSSQPSGVQLTVDETSPTSGWTEVGWAAGSLDTQNNPVCPAGKASYTGSNVGVNLTANQTQVVCVMNTKAPETRNLEICKVVVGNGDLAVRSGSFNFNVFVGGVQVHNGLPGGGINASEPNPDSNPGANGTEVCKTVAVNTSQTVQVVEWGSRPTGWDSPANDAADYPKYSINGGVQVANGTTEVIPAGSADLKVSFYNREKLPTKNVTFQKYICDTLGDVSRNEGSGGVDQVGMPSISAAGGLSGQLNQTAAPAGSSEAVNPSNDGRGNCHLWGSDLTKYPEETGTWDMVIYDNGRNEPPLQTVNIPQGGTISVPLTSAVLLEALKANSDGARVEEVFKAGYGFGSLKCYTDHLNQDNWEWLDFNPGGIPSGDVYCIAYNVPADKEIVIEKRFIGAESWGEGDIPTFTFTNPSITPVCKPVLNSSNDHVYIVCTVPYDWNGTVSETPPAGWKDVTDTDLCLRQEEGQLAGALVQPVTLAPDFVFCNQPVGDVVIVKYENVPPATTQNWTFSGTLPGAPVGLSTTGTTNDTDVQQTTLSNVPAGSYTLAELQGQGVCESGDTSSDYQTRGLVQVDGSLPSAGAVNAAPIIGSNDLNVTVQKGTTTYVVFGNQGCGSVLSAANLQVFKYSDPAANFSGTTELAGWTISITGTAGAANGQNFSEDTVLGNGAFFGGIPDGTYTVCETPKAGWAVVGSKYNLVDQAGVCRTGVVVNLDQTVVLKFYNQPRVNIEVNKTEISLATPGGAPGNGWSFTLTGCGITPQVKATGVDGKATFTDLPPAVGCSYTVTETVIGGWSAINPVQVTAPATAGQTAVLNFTNIKIEVCTNCFTIVTPTPTPEKPTPTATPTDPSDPTATPTEEPTKEPTKEPGEEPTEDTAGEKTPGPGQTPIAPSTGTGLLGSGPGGVNMLFALVGLLAISLGTTFLALGRKSSRR